MKKMSRKGMGKFILGSMLGAGIGMLLTPKKGSELRKDLSNKLTELLNKAKEIDVNEVKEEVTIKISEIKEEIKDLDKEKALGIAKEKSEQLKVKIEELLALAKEKGTPVLEDSVKEVKKKAIEVTKDVLKKLESGQNDKKDTKGEK